MHNILERPVQENFEGAELINQKIESQNYSLTENFQNRHGLLLNQLQELMNKVKQEMNPDVSDEAEFLLTSFVRSNEYQQILSENKNINKRINLLDPIQNSIEINYLIKLQAELEETLREYNPKYLLSLMKEIVPVKIGNQIADNLIYKASREELPNEDIKTSDLLSEIKEYKKPVYYNEEKKKSKNYFEVARDLVKNLRFKSNNKAETKKQENDISEAQLRLMIINIEKTYPLNPEIQIIKKNELQKRFDLQEVKKNENRIRETLKKYSKRQNLTNSEIHDVIRFAKKYPKALKDFPRLFNIYAKHELEGKIGFTQENIPIAKVQDDTKPIMIEGVSRRDVVVNSNKSEVRKPNNEKHINIYNQKEVNKYKYDFEVSVDELKMRIKKIYNSKSIIPLDKKGLIDSAIYRFINSSEYNKMNQLEFVINEEIKEVQERIKSQRYYSKDSIGTIMTAQRDSYQELLQIKVESLEYFNKNKLQNQGEVQKLKSKIVNQYNFENQRPVITSLHEQNKINQPLEKDKLNTKNTQINILNRLLTSKQAEQLGKLLMTPIFGAKENN